MDKPDGEVLSSETVGLAYHGSSCLPKLVVAGRAGHDYLPCSFPGRWEGTKWCEPCVVVGHGRRTGKLEAFCMTLYSGEKSPVASISLHLSLSRNCSPLNICKCAEKDEHLLKDKTCLS